MNKNPGNPLILKILVQTRNPGNPLIPRILVLMAFFTVCIASAQKPIDLQEAILIGGINQYVTIQGKDDSAPLLLFLHGGPGRSVMSYAHKFTAKLQEYFIVIQWDQRETGKTLLLNTSPVPLTLSVFQNDTQLLIKSLLKRFARKKLYLVGHSWGTALGFYIAEKYPELLYAYIPIGAMVNQLESERIVLSLMKAESRKTANQKKTEELATIKIPFENGEQLYYHRKWLFDFNGSQRIISKNDVLTWSSTWLPVYNEASKTNLSESLSVIHCPVYFFAGRKDYQTNSGLAEAYFKNLTAPKKGFYWFDHSGHSIPSSEPGRMQAIIIEEILNSQKSKRQQFTH